MSDPVCLYQSMSLSPSPQALPSPSSHSLLMFPIILIAIPQHITISLSHFTVPAALHKTLHITPCNMPSHVAMNHICNTRIFIELKTYLNHLKCTIFSTGGVRNVCNFKYMCSQFLCCVCALIILTCWLFF